MKAKSLIESGAYFRAAESGNLNDEACQNCELISNGNGTYTNSRCRLPKLKVDLGKQVWVSEFCAIHTSLEHCNGDVGELLPEGAEEAVAALLQSERREIDTTFSKNDINRFGDPYGSPSEPISDLETNKLEIENEKRRHICFKATKVSGPIIIKNCDIGKIEFDLAAGSILTIVDSRINELSWHSNDAEGMSFRANSSQIERVKASHQEIGKIGAKNTTMGRFDLQPNQIIKGPIVLTKSECHFVGGDFSHASVAVAKRLSFSESKVKGCRMSPWTTDEWQTLLRSYGGNNSLFAVLLFLVFAIPLLTDYAVWAAVQKAQYLIKSLPLIDTAGTGISRCLAAECEPMNLVLLILGYQNGLAYLFLTVSLLLLNVLRLMMTREVSSIRESSELSGRYPERGRVLPPLKISNAQGGSKFAAWRFSYRHLTAVHHLISILLIVSLGSFLLSAASLLGETVWVPAR